VETTAYVRLAMDLFEIEMLRSFDEADHRHQSPPRFDEPELDDAERESTFAALNDALARCNEIGLRVCAKHVAELIAKMNNKKFYERRMFRPSATI
jgi:hypothetical protein